MAIIRLQKRCGKISYYELVTYKGVYFIVNILLLEPAVRCNIYQGITPGAIPLLCCIRHHPINGDLSSVEIHC